MWRLRVGVALVLLSYTALSHPIEEKENVRETREAEARVCCPCPDDDRAVQSKMADGIGANIGSRSSVVDDCPCRSRSGDSDASPSVFSPKSMPADGNELMSTGNKEDLKPLLQPEVNLASSVLETLRDATEEEYRDALARDAAKDAKSAISDDDSVSDNDSLVAIVVNPSNVGSEDDIISEASHVQESRCVTPTLESARANDVNQSKPSLRDILKLPNLRPKIMSDMDNSANNVNERLTEPMNKGLAGLKIKSNPNLLKLIPQRSKSIKSSLDDLKSALKLRNIFKESDKGNNAVEIPKSNFNKNLLGKSMKKPTTHIAQVDSTVDASNIQESRKPVLKIKNPTILRDAESLSQKSDKFENPKENLLYSLKTPNLSNLLKSALKLNLANKDTSTERVTPNIQVISRDKTAKTEILDALPSPSEINNVVQNEFIENSSLSSITQTDEKNKGKLCIVKPSLTEQKEPIKEPININNDKSENIVLDTDDSMENIKAIKPNSNNDNRTESDMTFIKSLVVEQDNKNIDNPNNNNEQNTEEFIIEKAISDTSVETFDIETDSASDSTNDTAQIIDSDSTQNDDTGVDNSTADINNDDIDINQIDDELSIAGSDELSEIPQSNESIEIINEPSDSNNENEVTMLDLENMSNSLLEKNTGESNTITDELVIKSEEEVDDLHSQDEPTTEERTVSGSDNISEPVGTDENVLQSKSDNSSIDCMDQNEDTTNVELSVDKTMTNESPEMDTGASDQVLNLIQKGKQFRDNSPFTSPLLPDISLQPLQLPTLNGLNLRPIPSLSNILNVSPQLQPVTSFGNGLSNVLDLSAKNANNEIIAVSNDDGQDEFEMSNDASAINSQKVPLNPLDRINLDILQIRPISLTRSNSLKQGMGSGVNLNSYKANILAPKGLKLKPIKLESSLGNKDGLLGASLSIGSNLKPNLRLKNFGQTTPLVKSSLDLPNFAQIRGNLRQNAQNLLNSPIATAGRNAFNDNLGSSPINALSDNIRAHTENTVRNLHRSLAPVAEIRSNKYAKPTVDPKEVLEMISNRHSELNNNLQSIHNDITNKLSSIHDSIIDTPKLQSIRIPTISYKVPVKGKTEKERMQVKSKQSNILASKMPKSNIPKMNQYSDLKRLQPPRQNKMKPLRIPAAASSLVPKTVKVPELERTTVPALSRKPLVSSNSEDIMRQRSNPRMPKLSRPVPQTFKSIKRPAFKSRLNPFRESKVKVTFSSTTLPPITTIGARSTKNIGHKMNTKPSGHIARKSSLLKRKYNKFNDASGSASELIPSKAIVPITNPQIHEKVASLRQNAEFKKINSNANIARSRPSNEINPTASVAKNGKVPLSWPKPSENSFITKVREALNSRLANIRPGIILPTFKARESLPSASERSSSDMINSPSSIIEAVSSPDMMKENIPYKCKMVCVRE